MLYNERQYELARFPLRNKDPLRAWDAADDYILEHLQETDAFDGAPSVLIVNDAFGALGTVLHEHAPTVWNDSFLSCLALEYNLTQNGADPESMIFVPGSATPDGPFDLVLIKFPKSLVWFEDQLRRLRPLLHADSKVIAGGMIKHTPTRAYEQMESILGPMTTSQGRKKARIAFATLDADLALPPAAPPSVYTLPGYDLELGNRPNVFAYEHLDIGTRLLLDSLPRTDLPLRIADLGCGNGVLGLAAARRCPNAKVLFVDESYQAVACARENAAAAGLDGHEFVAADGLRDVQQESLDLVLCNPPFHQAQAVDDIVAWRMFEQAQRCIRPPGELLVVGNRHLGYHIKLQRLFGNAGVVRSDPKFVVLRGLKERRIRSSQ